MAEAYFSEQGNFDYHPNQFVEFAQKAGLSALARQINSLNLPDKIDGAEIHDYVKIIMDKAPLARQIKHKLAAFGDAKNVNNLKREQQLANEIIAFRRKQEKA